jgi:hypothetical protein
VEPEQGRARRLAPAVAAFAVVVTIAWAVAALGPFGSTPARDPVERASTTEPPAVAGSAEPAVSARVGFVGLPPEGAAPSAPRRGDLVLGYFGEQYTHWYQVWVYEDGRLIWQREGNLREGANPYATGFLEQRLTPEGVDLLRRRGSAEDALFGFPWRPPYPASWLPPRAWADRAIRAYVPSRYRVCYQGLLRPFPASRILSWLPAPAAEPLLAGGVGAISVDGWLPGHGGGCSTVTTDEARSIAAALEAAGFGQDLEFQREYALIYYVSPEGVPEGEAAIRFDPVLPHGEAGCTSCG